MRDQQPEFYNPRMISPKNSANKNKDLTSLTQLYDDASKLIEEDAEAAQIESSNIQYDDIASPGSASEHGYLNHGIGHTISEETPSYFNESR